MTKIKNWEYGRWLRKGSIVYRTVQRGATTFELRMKRIGRGLWAWGIVVPLALSEPITLAEGFAPSMLDCRYFLHFQVAVVIKNIKLIHNPPRAS